MRSWTAIRSLRIVTGRGRAPAVLHRTATCRWLSANTWQRTPGDGSSFRTKRADGVSRRLITAWAAGGADRQVEVEVKGLGKVKVLACTTGSVYRAKRKGDRCELVLLDADGRHPTARMR